MDELLKEVLGTEPPCARYKLTRKTIENVIQQLDRNDIEVKIEKRNCADKDTIRRYGVVLPHALAINGVIKILGRRPNESEIRRLVEST